MGKYTFFFREVGRALQWRCCIGWR